MSKKVEVELNLNGIREMMKSPGMMTSLQDAGNAVAGIANGSHDGYMTDTHTAPFTAVCTVYPSTREAGIDNAQNNTLLKATQGAGLTWKTKG